MPPIPSALLEAFRQRFGRDCVVAASAPGRVNLIGEHVDYNDGFVLPLAIQQRTWALTAPGPPGVLHVHSEQFRSSAADDLSTRAPAQDAPAWLRYVGGAARLLIERGARLQGASLLISGDVPIGAGVSSSAALTVSTTLALAQLAGEPMPRDDVVELCRAAEHRFAGVPCGIMDPLAILSGQAGAALLIDCRRRTVEPISAPPAALGLALIDSGVRHALGDGRYAQRRAECLEALAYFQQLDPGLTALRDVSPAKVRAQAAQMPPVLAARAQHVVREMERTRAAADALRSGDYAQLGALVRASHESLRLDFEVSWPEADALVEFACATPGVWGARMVGGGFGGAVLAIGQQDVAERLTHGLRSANTPQQCLPVQASGGAGLHFP